MGTRSLTVFTDEDDTEIVVMYRQMDGYPTGHGQDLADFLKQFQLVSGIPVSDKTLPMMANGMSCLAAQTIMHFKQKLGGGYGKEVTSSVGAIYLHPAGTRHVGTCYTYYVSMTDENIILKVVESGSNEWTSTNGKVFPAHPEQVLWNGFVGDFNGQEIEELEA